MEAVVRVKVLNHAYQALGSLIGVICVGIF